MVHVIFLFSPDKCPTFSRRHKKKAKEQQKPKEQTNKKTKFTIPLSKFKDLSHEPGRYGLANFFRFFQNHLIFKSH
jgi:hypothetical protein